MLEQRGSETGGETRKNVNKVSQLRVKFQKSVAGLSWERLKSPERKNAETTFQVRADFSAGRRQDQGVQVLFFLPLLPQRPSGHAMASGQSTRVLLDGQMSACFWAIIQYHLGVSRAVRGGMTQSSIPREPLLAHSLSIFSSG